MKRKHRVKSSSASKRGTPEREPRQSQGSVQYTVRNVPAKADLALRHRATELKISLNEMLRRAILREAGMGIDSSRSYHDLDHLAGTWVKDPVFDAIIDEQDRVDEDLWK
jgi:hypothetical protein